MKRKIDLPRMNRAFRMDMKPMRATDAAPTPDDLYQMVASTDEPIDTWWWSAGWIREVLRHKKGAIDTSYLDAGAAFLVAHDQDQMVGVIEEYEIDESKGQLIVRFRFSSSPFAQQIRDDIERGIRRQASIGYQVTAADLTKKGDNNKGVLDTYECDWIFYEASTVPVAADIKAGTGKSKKAQEEQLAAVYRRAAEAGNLYPVVINDGEVAVEGRAMTKEELEAKAKADAEAAAREAGKTATATATIEAEREEIRKEREKTAAQREKDAMDIIATAATNGITDEKKIGPWLQRFKEGKATQAEIYAEMFQEVRTKGKAVRNPDDALEHPDWRKYSYARAILRAHLATDPSSGAKFDGIEAEYDQQLRKDRPKGMKDNGGILLPLALMPQEERERRNEMIAAVRGQRAYPLDSATSTEGAEFKFIAPGDFIEMLRARLAVAQLGARFITGLLGGLTFPRQTGAATGSWVAEEGTVTDSMAAFDTMALTPKTLMITTGYTRQLLAIEDHGIEAIVRADLAAVHARTIDIAAIQGTGASNQPRGVANQSGVLSVDMGAGAGADAVPTFAKLIDMQGKVGDANADMGALGYLMTPLLAATMKRTLVASSAGSDMIWTGPFGDGFVAGYRALASNDVTKVWNNGATTGGSEHGLLFGNWNELLIASWNAMEALVDPYSAKKSGRIEVTTFQMIDCGVRHPVSFCIGINAIP